MEQETGPVCIVCRRPATTIRGGRDYCGRHHDGHSPGPAIVLCALDGCGSPAVAKVGDRDVCRDHLAWAERGSAA
jgi:hypothetical protein